jgi:zinc protease
MRRDFWLTPVIVALVFVWAASSQTLPNGVQKGASVEGITEYTFPNGLRVLLFPDASKPKVTVNMTYLVGSRHEGYGETGMAHLMEHMLFLRTTSDKDVKQELTDHGADWNGTTSWDRTNYFETVNASDENLRWATSLEAERMVHMRIEKALLDKEMTVVRNEFESGENSPTRMLQQRTLEAAYTFHNYGKLPIGSRSDIENVPIERLAAFYRKYYQPDNAILTIAGQFDSSKALALVASSVGAIPRPERVLDKTYTVEPTQDGERTVTLRRAGDDQEIAVVYHVPAATHPDSAALQVLATMLSDNPSGRLYRALVYNQKAVAVAMNSARMHDPGFAIGFVQLREDQSIDEARDILVKTVEGLANEPPSKEELDRAKNRILKQIELNLTNTEQIGLNLSEYAASGDWRLLFLSRDQIKNVTGEDVVRVAKAYFKSSNRTLGEFVPTKNPDRAEIPAAPDAVALLKNYTGGESKSEGEVFSPTPANVEARVVRAKQLSGLRMSLLARKTRGGNVVARVRLDFGDEKSVFGKSMIAQLTGGMLIRGTKNKTRQQIQDEMDRLKARITVVGGPTEAIASIETTEPNLPGALRLAAEVLREPSFPDNEFDQLKQQRIAGLEANKSEPQVLGPLEIGRRLNPYPPGDVRHVGTIDEQIAELQKVTLEEVRNFHAQFYGASDAKVVVSGQFDVPQVQKLAEDLFGNWKSPGSFTRVPNPYVKVSAGDQRIETPDKQNAMWLGGLTFKMADDDPDYPAMLIANYIFGGSGGSRLFKRVRDKEGLSYGVGSGLQTPSQDDGSSLVLYAISAPQNSPKVEASIKDELTRSLKDGFSPDEVTAAKKSWLEEQMVGRSQDQQLLTLLMQRERFDRTMKWDESLEQKVAGLTPDQVAAAFRRHIDAAGLVLVKAGDFKKAGVFQQ